MNGYANKVLIASRDTHDLLVKGARTHSMMTFSCHKRSLDGGCVHGVDSLILALVLINWTVVRGLIPMLNFIGPLVP